MKVDVLIKSIQDAKHIDVHCWSLIHYNITLVEWSMWSYTNCSNECGPNSVRTRTRKCGSGYGMHCVDGNGRSSLFEQETVECIVQECSTGEILPTIKLSTLSFRINRGLNKRGSCQLL